MATKATAHAVRIYWCRGSYGREPRESPGGQPLGLNGCPLAGDRCSVWFGEVPAEIAQRVRERDAMAQVAVEWLLGMGTAGQSFSAAVAAALPQQEDFDAPWYVTVALERSVELTADRAEDTTAPELEEIEESIGADAARAFEMVLATIRPILGVELAGRRPRDRIYLTVEGRDRPIFMPKPELTARGAAVRPIDEFPSAALSERIAELEKRHTSWMPNLETAAHWDVAALDTEDKWKRFYWSFLALEILTHKLRARVGTAALEALRMPSGGHAGAPSSVLAEVARTNNMPLASEFALVAAYLSPETAEDDLDVFRRALKARGDMSHGTRVDIRQLPTVAVRAVVAHYFDLARGLWP